MGRPPWRGDSREITVGIVGVAAQPTVGQCLGSHAARSVIGKALRSSERVSDGLDVTVAVVAEGQGAGIDPAPSR